MDNDYLQLMDEDAPMSFVRTTALDPDSRGLEDMDFGQKPDILGSSHNNSTSYSGISEEPPDVLATSRSRSSSLSSLSSSSLSSLSEPMNESTDDEMRVETAPGSIMYPASTQPIALDFQGEEEDSDENEPMTLKVPSRGSSSRAHQEVRNTFHTPVVPRKRRAADDLDLLQRSASISSLLPSRTSANDQQSPSRPSKRRRCEDNPQPALLNTSLPRYKYAFGIPIPSCLRENITTVREFCIPDFLGAVAASEHRSGRHVRTARPDEAFGVALPGMLFEVNHVDFELPLDLSIPSPPNPRVKAVVPVPSEIPVRTRTPTNPKSPATTAQPLPTSFSHRGIIMPWKFVPPPTLQSRTFDQAPQPQLPPLYHTFQAYSGPRRTTKYASMLTSSVLPHPNTPVSCVPAQQPPAPILAPIPAPALFVRPGAQGPLTSDALILPRSVIPYPNRPLPPPERRLPVPSVPTRVRLIAQTPLSLTAFGFPLPPFLLRDNDDGDMREFRIPDFLTAIAAYENRGAVHMRTRRTDAFGVKLPEVLLKFQETPTDFALPPEVLD
ncbi:hypothetical protein K438DRAFT_1845659 [Mycena galopus ATCC 62051]|nr:hypothetical protein K438DRAFT_1845659 [Mycena galopus ATCC 62051]